MKYFVCVLLFFLTSLIYAQDLPRNPKAGECYVRCRDDNGKISGWKKIECDLVTKKNHLKIDGIEHGVYTEKDKKRIKKHLVKILEEGYTLELLSHFHSNKTDSINEKRSILNAKILLSYLKTKGNYSKQILLTAYGNSKPLKECLNRNTCSDYFSKNTRIEYRVVNATTRKEGIWRYDNKKKVWCYKGK